MEFECVKSIKRFVPVPEARKETIKVVEIREEKGPERKVCN